MLKRIIATCISLIIHMALISQENLVPNPSFEEFITCPINNCNVNQLTHWFNPTNGSPDFWSTCPLDSTSGCNLPSNSNNWPKSPQDGENIVGLFLFTYGLENIVEREYLGVKLKKSLSLNTQYICRLYYSPVQKKGLFEIPCFIKNLQMYFSDTFNYQITKEDGPFVTSNKPQIQNNVIMNLPNIWSKLSSCVRGNFEKYLFIGNFSSDLQTEFAEDCKKSFPNASYNYIDNVGVYEFDPLPDTILLCENQSIQLGKKFLDGTYKWNTGETNSTIVVDKSGRYIVNVYIDECILSDTVQVYSESDLIESLPKDTLICEGESLKYNINFLSKYSLNGKPIRDSFVINKAGNYHLKIQNNCNEYLHNFIVESEECNCDLFFPNVFNPNSLNEINRIFKSSTNCKYDYVINKFTLFDRWGNFVYRNSDLKYIKWDGTFDGKNVSPGVYVWNMEYEYNYKGTILKKLKNGNVTVIK